MRFRADLCQSVGNSLGGLTNVGFDTGAVSPNRKTYYAQQWMYGFQYAPTANDVHRPHLRGESQRPRDWRVA